MTMAEPEAVQACHSRFEFKKEGPGKGGMGEVYLVHDAYTQREVAIKLAKLAMLEDPEIGARGGRPVDARLKALAAE
jgi:serine/threonine protein kinase